MLVSQQFGCSVSPTSPLAPSSFHLVSSFGRSTVRLNVDSVSLILQACLGGNAKDYNVNHLSGFMICKLRNHSCKTFLNFFHLWSGGPNWRRDFVLWQQEQEAEWNFVGPKFKKSYADTVKSNTKNTSFLALVLSYKLCI